MSWPVLLVGVLLLSIGSASATTVRMVETDEHLTMSDAVVLASVVERESFYAEDGMIFTDTTLEVSEVLYGAIESSTITVRQMGGVIDDVASVIAGNAHLTLDTEVVLFLADREPEEDVLFLTALSLSEYVVVGSQVDGDVELLRDFNGLVFYNPDAVEPLGARETEHLTLGTLRNTIDALNARGL